MIPRSLCAAVIHFSRALILTSPFSAVAVVLVTEVLSSDFLLPPLGFPVRAKVSDFAVSQRFFHRAYACRPPPFRSSLDFSAREFSCGQRFPLGFSIPHQERATLISWFVLVFAACALRSPSVEFSSRCRVPLVVSEFGVSFVHNSLLLFRLRRPVFVLRARLRDFPKSSS
jgi:hypothetical protein